jgi:hypothetical protein
MGNCAVVITKETGPELDLFMEILTLVENVVFLHKLYSIHLLRTVQNSGKYSVPIRP